MLEGDLEALVQAERFPRLDDVLGAAGAEAKEKPREKKRRACFF
jgi:hypothetical protein